MGTKVTRAITSEKANSLFWLGRYIDRVFVTIRYYNIIFDKMLDEDKEIYHRYCKELDIPDFYNNDAHFMTSYLYELDNPDSIHSNLKRAYDNAIVLREEISTEVLSYIQMGMNTFLNMEESEAPVLMLQEVVDDIYAFWGALSENTNDQVSRDIIRLGKFGERVDLYCRLGYSSELVGVQYHKLHERIDRLCNTVDIKGLGDLKLCEDYDSSELMEEIVKLTQLFEVI